MNTEKTLRQTKHIHYIVFGIFVVAALAIITAGAVFYRNHTFSVSDAFITTD